VKKSQTALETEPYLRAVKTDMLRRTGPW